MPGRKLNMHPLKLRALNFLEAYCDRHQNDKAIWLKSRVGVKPSYFHKKARRLRALVVLIVKRYLKRNEEKHKARIIEVINSINFDELKKSIPKEQIDKAKKRAEEKRKTAR